MGTEVARLSGGPRVGPDSALWHTSSEPRARDAESFGRWLARERRLRGISVEFVAARLKLNPERLAAIESDAAPLEPDGHGRSIARSLALAIGADPQAAAAFFQCDATGGRARTSARRVFTGAALGTALGGLVAVVSVGVYAVWASRVESPIGPARAEQVVYRPDYVGQLLGDPDRASVESRPAVRQTPDRP